jgi:glycolate oxidase iron-sulfur subunit
MEEADRCCGFGGIFSLKHYDLAMTVAEEKVIRIEESQADVVATGCPGCSLHIGDALTQAGKKTQVKHTVQILADSIRSRKEFPGAKVEIGNIQTKGEVDPGNKEFTYQR